MLYLSPYEGKGTRENPFRPRGLWEPEASAIDLRSDCTRAEGYALVWNPNYVPAKPGMLKLAEAKGEPLAGVSHRAIASRYAANYAGDTLIDDAVESVLLRPRDGHWGPLTPGIDGCVEAWLGGERWVHFPVLAGGLTRSDDFNRADENPLGNGNWTIGSGGSDRFRLVTNRIVGNATGAENYEYWSGDSFGNDQFSQIQLIATANSSPGVTVRGSGVQRDYYAVQRFPLNGSNSDLFKYLTGTYTSLNTGSYAWTNNDYIKIQVSGTTLTVYADASSSPTTQCNTATDGSLSSGKPGIYDFGGGSVSTLDNWSGGDLTVPDTTYALRRFA